MVSPLISTLANSWRKLWPSSDWPPPSRTTAGTPVALSALLAATRPRVTQAAAKLKADGIIDYRRAMVRILDRRRLEAASCECYEDTRRSA